MPVKQKPSIKEPRTSVCLSVTQSNERARDGHSRMVIGTLKYFQKFLTLTPILTLTGHRRGGVPALPNFGGSFLFMQTPFVAELPNLTW